VAEGGEWAREKARKKDYFTGSAQADVRQKKRRRDGRGRVQYKDVLERLMKKKSGRKTKKVFVDSFGMDRVWGGSFPPEKRGGITEA